MASRKKSGGAPLSSLSGGDQGAHTLSASAAGQLLIEYRKAADLIPYARNSRTHSDQQVAQIAASMREFGWTNPILIDEAGTIIAGHGRLLAAQKLKMGDVPVITLAGLSDAQRRALVIADNKLAMNAGWNDDLLAIELADLSAEGFDLDLLGFDLDELADLGIGAEPGEPGDGSGGAGSLAEKFMIPPFSVLNAREGWWQDRKKAWLKLGIQSECGRGENLLKMSETVLEPDPKKRAAKAKGKGLAETFGSGSASGGDRKTGETTGDRFLRQSGKSKGNVTGALAAPDTYRDPQFYAKKRKAEAKLGRELSIEEFRALDAGPARAIGTTDWARANGITGNASDGDAGVASGTSIFDPVLSELCYRWFSPLGGLILDPFAGGSVRGIVAAKLGREYIGHELRPEQVSANRMQAAEICVDGVVPAWVEGDSRGIDQSCASVEADFIFSCPPYADLEVYSDDPADLSTLKYAEFRAAYFEIIAKSCALLKADRFACFVVGDVRDKSGAYYNFVGDTVEAFRAAGLDFYNEAILVTAVGSLPIRAAKQFSASRKLGKTHQNVLVFLKGNGKKATQACGKVDVAECLAAIEEASDASQAQ